MSTQKEMDLPATHSVALGWARVIGVFESLQRQSSRKFSRSGGESLRGACLP